LEKSLSRLQQMRRAGGVKSCRLRTSRCMRPGQLWDKNCRERVQQHAPCEARLLDHHVGGRTVMPSARVNGLLLTRMGHARG
jgi:hypothetical protein